MVKLKDELKNTLGASNPDPINLRNPPVMGIEVFDVSLKSESVTITLLMVTPLTPADAICVTTLGSSLSKVIEFAEILSAVIFVVILSDLSY